MILVAPAKLYAQSGPEGNYDRFMDFEIDPSIKDFVDKIIIFISNDTENLIASAQLYKEKLSAELIELKGQGHFRNEQRSEVEFRELIEVIVN